MRRLVKLEKTYPKKVVEQVKIALAEIGEIKPWYDKEVTSWVFEHPLYPERYGGETKEEVIQGYPLYLANLFQAQYEGRLAPETQKSIKGRGGFRPGAGRPRNKVPTVLKRIPRDIAQWLDADSSHIEQIRTLIS